jgi:glutamate formiminotransferase
VAVPEIDLEDVLSDEIEVARAAEQLAKHLVDTVSEPQHHARRCNVGIDDVVPLMVILTRHVASLEEILERFNALSRQHDT